MTDLYKGTFKITPRLDEDNRQMFGEPEFRETLGYIGHRLGLTGSFFLVGDVVAAFDAFMDTRPEDMARALEQFRQAEHQVHEASRKVTHASRALGEVRKIFEETKEETRQDMDSQGGTA